MNSFPLYNRLQEDIPNKDLTVKQKNEFIAKIPEMDSNGDNIFYVLIRIFAMNENIMSDTPYSTENEETKKNCYNITWDLTDLPQKLRHILYKFVCMHSEQMKEQKDREQSTI